jgi:hypothetical protein
MMNETTTPNENQSPLPIQYVSAIKLLDLLFDEASRPSLRWVRDQQKTRTLPFCKIGRRVFFDPQIVKAHLDAKAAGKVKSMAVN